MSDSDQTKRVTVFVADDHPIYREGLVGALRNDERLEVIGEAADGSEALEQIRELAPDVAVLDLAMPGMTGFEVLGAIGREGLGTRAVVLSASTDSEGVFRAVAEGASAYVPKESSREEVSEAILAASRGETMLAPGVQGGLADQIRARGSGDIPTGSPDRDLGLSEREFEVLKLTANGLSAPEIGFRLGVSSATVKTHMEAAYAKLGVSDRAGAVAEAMRRGLIE
jgi:two-component system nitrate/nitrite response regulator NarL